MNRYARLRLFAYLAALVTLGCLLLTGSALEPADRTERVRAFTRGVEFDYIGWTLDALRVKFFEFSLGIGNYLSQEARHAVVLEYLELVGRAQQIEGQLKQLYSDPGVSDPQAASQELRQQLAELNARRQQAAPLAESILQSQISYAIDALGLSLGGQPFPPVLYHSTPLPMALIVSPRDVIRQDENISLVEDLSIEEQVRLEEQVDQALDVSSLVVGIGGVGTYPSMVYQVSYLDVLTEIVSHEWVHNFLTLRPLGANYMTSPELRIMNETTANIAGKEIGRAVLEIFYPELAPPPEPATPQGESAGPPEPPAFDFRREMHVTRLEVDKLLAQGKIEEAEAYMEMRRQVFWQNGYRHLRKLNQAYFAFHGAYADEPGGAAGAAEDPVGAAVRALYSRSPSLAAFLNQISWMSSFEQLQKAVGAG
ncbi:MAG: hypothetical protein JXA78_15705 [Anaerolineales bacterium]|nr:hypothetical protein [Anaerolineales bacterium]